MTSNRKTNAKKHAREDDKISTRRPAKKARVLSPLRSKDREDTARTQKKIMVELRKELETCKEQADEAAQLKQQRDFAVHVAASLYNLQSKILDAWRGDMEKAKGMKRYKGSVENLEKMENQVVELEELLKQYPQLAECLKAIIGKEEIESLNGWIEDFKVKMVGKDGRKRGNSPEASVWD
jgi:hypothetical protein